jgi:hypothetical protein
MGLLVEHERRPSTASEPPSLVWPGWHCATPAATVLSHAV